MKEFIRTAEKSFTFNQGVKEIKRICQPFLNEWGFENFYYVRLTKKGRLVYLTNHVEFTLNYWEAGLPLRAGAVPEQSRAVLWQNFMDESILSFAKVHRCFDGFTFVDRYPDFVQFASFLRSSPTENEFYVTNQNKIRCWLREFEWKNINLIKHVEKNPLVLPEEYLGPQKKAFYPERTLDLVYKDIQGKVTFRELDCLCLLSKGFSYTHISNILSISSRTVETHLDNIKNNFGLYSRDDLAGLAYANPLIHSYAPRL